VVLLSLALRYRAGTARPLNHTVHHRRQRQLRRREAGNSQCEGPCPPVPLRGAADFFSFSE
jgi:hypothetical protein